MKKTILITGATDGIGFETAKALVNLNHNVIVHGRNSTKVDAVVEQLSELNSSSTVESIIADLSSLTAVSNMITEVGKRFNQLDVLINNAGVFSTPVTKVENLDIRFVVNTIAPYMLSKALLPLIKPEGRIVNLSSAAQATVSIDALEGKRSLSNNEAYAQSKLALTMWSRALGEEQANNGIVVVSVNPKSLLGSKMVKDTYGIAGGDLTLGSDILVRAALSDEFNRAYGHYFDNDIERFSQPHPDALNDERVKQLIKHMESIIATLV
ncbi:MAG: SDR family NAD(P)-dependent oxidoreductase [Aliivibrio sp.]|nr:SDR family NAD(P)-dependent oxidoreductase [Aliivibrio sp.]